MKNKFKIENKEVIAWTRIKEQAETEIKTNERMNIMNKEIIKVAEEQIKIHAT